ncbi:MAG: [protein-PII] uridylyltransferase [Pelovirga sp.]
MKQQMTGFEEDLVPFNPPETTANFESVRASLVAEARRFLQANYSKLQQDCMNGGASRLIVKQLSRMFDQLNRHIFAIASRGFDPASSSDCALLAVGGYGREEMSPRSDLDIMFYYRPEGKEAIRVIADRILYLLWDLNLDVGYSIRCAADCLEQADDPTVRTSLLDVRLVAGEQRISHDFVEDVAIPLKNRDPRSFIKQKLSERETRKKKYGSSVYLLEPNLKEGEGGLRELQDALWIARIKYKADSLHELLIRGIVTEDIVESYVLAQDYLWTIRNFLHFNGQRKTEQLTFDVQQQIANHLGYVNKIRGSAVEQFMQDYYAHANQNEYLASRMILDATQSRTAPKGMFSFLVRRHLEDGFYLLRDELRASKHLTLLQNPELMMVAFELSQKHQVELCLELKQLIRDNLHLITDKVRRSKRINESFMRILRDFNGVAKTLHKMHHLQFLNAFIPEFKRIYCKVQFDLYHIYTVDIHTLFAIEEVEKLSSGEYRDTQPLLSQIIHNIEKPELLLLALLFHDIGKGSGKDHSIRGAEMVPRIARRLRLRREDTRRLEFLVGQHLKMAHISQRRDLQDMKMIAQFAELMQTSENLRMLYLLTFADIKAVGPDVWSEWKGTLLQELFEKTYDVLEKKDFYQEQRTEKARNRKRKVRLALRGEFSEGRIIKTLNSLNNRYLLSYRSKEIIPHMRLALNRGRRALAMQVEHIEDAKFTEVTIATIDSPGLFSQIAGVMAAHSINILGAQIHTRKNGDVLDVLQVNSPVGEIVNKPKKWRNVEEDLTAVLEGRIMVEDLVANIEEPRFMSRTPRQTQRPNRIEFDNEVSDSYTVIDIYANDKVGLLYEITRTLKELGLYIAVSKIATKVDQAADVFYVHDIFGQKIIESVKIDEIRKTMLERLD